MAASTVVSLVVFASSARLPVIMPVTNELTLLDALLNETPFAQQPIHRVVWIVFLNFELGFLSTSNPCNRFELFFADHGFMEAIVVLAKRPHANSATIIRLFKDYF